ncbi:unnamed protein product [Phytomonas sp. Hart1]|nr:unnamed protein product [Phytomonas sp. Hart1]|eukprot:CCW67486.1 unnamed protein product [Phytomonas sp. isolate Hart1]
MFRDWIKIHHVSFLAGCNYVMHIGTVMLHCGFLIINFALFAYLFTLRTFKATRKLTRVGHGDFT